MDVEAPVFEQRLESATYDEGTTAATLNGTATVTDGGTITYRWQTSPNGEVWRTIPGETGPTYTPSAMMPGKNYYRVIATNTVEEILGLFPAEDLYPADDLYPSMRTIYWAASSTSNVAIIEVLALPWTETEKLQDYMRQLRLPYIKLCRLRFLQPDGSTAFALDNNPRSVRSGAFIADGTINCNLQNGQRRSATVTLSNLDMEYDYNINKIWFGQEIALDEGLVLSNGEDYYIQQGVFVLESPQETLRPGERTITYNLVDKWAMLDGTLFGNLEGTYEVPVNTNVFEAMASVLNLDRGNGQPVDRQTPIFTEYYNGKTQELPDGTTVQITDSPYTLRIDSESGNYGDIELGLAGMLNAWIGYDPTGHLRVDPSQDDILDSDKPVLWQFSMEEAQLLGATYTVKNTEVYNDYIVIGESISDYDQPAGRAQNMDPSSDTNIYTGLGRRTKRESASGYFTQKQCVDLATWKLKRMSVVKKAVTISCIQMFHITENNLITLVRTDKPGAPVERHLIQGFSRPLAATGEMTINCVSVQDLPVATVTAWPE